jgi:hypothetical protein
MNPGGAAWFPGILLAMMILKTPWKMTMADNNLAHNVDGSNTAAQVGDEVLHNNELHNNESYGNGHCVWLWYIFYIIHVCGNKTSENAE